MVGFLNKHIADWAYNGPYKGHANLLLSHGRRPWYTVRERCRQSAQRSAAEMGVKGLSKNVIKLAWRSGKLSDLAEGTRIGVDAMGWFHKAVVHNQCA